MIRKNPDGDYPQIDNSAYIDSAAVVIGEVKIGRNVFIGPGSVLRADERGSEIIIRDNCNIQDRAIIHALEGTSVLIEENTSLAHGCIIHGPCKISRNCFIGFGSVVFNAEVGKGVIIKHLVVVEGVSISPEKVVGSSQLINSAAGVRELKGVEKKLKEFTEKIVKANLDLAKGYKNE